MTKIFFLFAIIISLSCNSNKNGNPRIVIITGFGDIKIELYPKQAPKTCAAFLNNIEKGYYNNINFYRVLKNEDLSLQDNYGIIQAGVWPNKVMADSIPFEGTKLTGLTHNSGTLSMARANGASATTEFFICIGEQKMLDEAGGNLPEDKLGFAAFGKVIEGMNVVRKIQDQQSNGDSFVKKIEIQTVEKL